MEYPLKDKSLQGGCFCGAVRFEIDGPILYSCFCHCRSCRRASGGAYVPWATFDKAKLRLVAGALKEYRSSPDVTRGHCANCGTTLTYEHKGRAGQVDVTLTSFEDPARFVPAAHIWVEDKLPWVHIDDDLPRFVRTTGSAEI